MAVSCSSPSLAVPSMITALMVVSSASSGFDLVTDSPADCLALVLPTCVASCLLSSRLVS